jgi:hypothetical protein
MIKVISFGCGVQSTSLLVLAAQGVIDYKTFLFANVGEDSENPRTLQYFHEVALPYAQSHGIELLELKRMKQVRLETEEKILEPETLYQRLTRPGSRSVGIPVRMSGNGAPGTRQCTADFKIKVIDKELKSRDNNNATTKELKKRFLKLCGITEINKDTMPVVLRHLDQFFKANEPYAQVGLGISLDEIQRMKPNMDKETIYWKVNAWPLIDLRMDRQSCVNVIRRAGIEVPESSECWFCPFHTIQQWQKMREDDPEHFWESCHLEKIINERRVALGKDQVWLTNRLKPLEQATTDLEQLSMFKDEIGCDSGYCFL